MSELIVQLTRIAEAFEEQCRLNEKSIRQAHEHHLDTLAYWKHLEEQRHEQEIERMEKRAKLDLEGVGHITKEAMKTHRGAIRASKQQQETERMQLDTTKLQVLLHFGRWDEAAKLLGIAEQPK